MKAGADREQTLRHGNAGVAADARGWDHLSGERSFEAVDPADHPAYARAVAAALLDKARESLGICVPDDRFPRVEIVAPGSLALYRPRENCLSIPLDLVRNGYSYAEELFRLLHRQCGDKTNSFDPDVSCAREFLARLGGAFMARIVEGTPYAQLFPPQGEEIKAGGRGTIVEMQMATEIFSARARQARDLSSALQEFGRAAAGIADAVESGVIKGARSPSVYLGLEYNRLVDAFGANLGAFGAERAVGLVDRVVCDLTDSCLHHPERILPHLPEKLRQVARVAEAGRIECEVQQCAKSMWLHSRRFFRDAGCRAAEEFMQRVSDWPSRVGELLAMDPRDLFRRYIGDSSEQAKAA